MPWSLESCSAQQGHSRAQTLWPLHSELASGPELFVNSNNGVYGVVAVTIPLLWQCDSAVGLQCPATAQGCHSSAREGTGPGWAVSSHGTLPCRLAACREPGRQRAGRCLAGGDGSSLFLCHEKDKASSREAPCQGSGSTGRCGTSLPFPSLFPKVPGSSPGTLIPRSYFFQI